MFKTKVTRKFQITIPKPIREALGIKVGDEIIIKLEGQKIVLIPKSRIKDPLAVLLNIFDKQIDLDAVKLVEESWNED